MTTSQYIFSSNETDFTTEFPKPIDLSGKQYEVALVTLDTYNSFPNIKENINNVFRYSADNGITWKEIILDTGSYELSNINTEIQRQMITNGDYDIINHTSYINIEPNLAELESIVSITNDSYRVNFGGNYSIGKILGFPAVILSSGHHESPNIVDINPINSVLVNTNIINGSYLNGFKARVIYSFAPSVGPGRKIVETPNPLIFLPVTNSELSSVRIWLTDQDMRPVDLRKEILTIKLVIREVKKRNTERSIIKAIKKLIDENVF